MRIEFKKEESQLHKLASFCFPNAKINNLKLSLMGSEIEEFLPPGDQHVSQIILIKTEPKEPRCIHLVVLFDYTTILWLRFHLSSNHFEILTKHVSSKINKLKIKKCF